MKETSCHDGITNVSEVIETETRFGDNDDNHESTDPFAMVPSSPSGNAAIETIEARGAAAICWAEQSARLRFAVLKQTNPECWILQRTKDGSIFAKLTSKGAQIIISVYPGIEIHGKRIVDQKILANGEISTHAKCYAKNALTGASTEVDFCKSNAEDFGGRQESAGAAWKTAEVARNDHMLAVLTGVATKAIGEISGLRTVSIQELEYAWGDSDWKDVNNISRGYGFRGERDQRMKINTGRTHKREGATQAKRKPKDQEDETAQKLRELANRIFALAGKDKDAAKELTHDITLTSTDRGTDNIRDLVGNAEAVEACLQMVARMEKDATQEGSDNASCDEIGGQDV